MVAGHQCTLRPVGLIGVLRPPVGVPISGIEDLRFTSITSTSLWGWVHW
jgi:hypothetical protein